jgi:hypothetical protein
VEIADGHQTPKGEIWRRAVSGGVSPFDRSSQESSPGLSCNKRSFNVSISSVWLYLPNYQSIAIAILLLPFLPIARRPCVKTLDVSRKETSPRLTHKNSASISTYKERHNGRRARQNLHYNLRRWWMRYVFPHSFASEDF